MMPVAAVANVRAGEQKKEAISVSHVHFLLDASSVVFKISSSERLWLVAAAVPPPTLRWSTNYTVAVSQAQSGGKNKQPPAVGEGHRRMRDDWRAGQITFAT